MVRAFALHAKCRGFESLIAHQSSFRFLEGKPQSAHRSLLHEKVWIVVGALTVVLIVCVISAISVRNGLIAQDEAVNENWSQIETQLQRRADLIPNLVATVKGYAQHEETFSPRSPMRVRGDRRSRKGTGNPFLAGENSMTHFSAGLLARVCVPLLPAAADFKVPALTRRVVDQSGTLDTEGESGSKMRFQRSKKHPADKWLSLFSSPLEILRSRRSVSPRRSLESRT